MGISHSHFLPCVSSISKCSLKGRAFLQGQFEFLLSLTVPSQLHVCHHHFKIILFFKYNIEGNYLFFLVSLLPTCQLPLFFVKRWLSTLMAHMPMPTEVQRSMHNLNLKKKSKSQRREWTLFLKCFRCVYLRGSPVLKGYDFVMLLWYSHTLLWEGAVDEKVSLSI